MAADTTRVRYAGDATTVIVAAAKTVVRTVDKTTVVATGTIGVNGAQGANGAAGAQGAQGANGAAGAQGAQGANGAAGAQGAQGANGAAGAQGAQGAQGPQGDSGARARQHAFVSTGYGTDYFGSAPLGTATTTALWVIKKIVLNSSGAATVTTATNVQWVDYLTTTYT